MTWEGPSHKLVASGAFGTKIHHFQYKIRHFPYECHHYLPQFPSFLAHVWLIMADQRYGHRDLVGAIFY